MATRNGPWQNHARIEWEYSLPAVTQGTTSLTATVEAYLRMDGSSSIIGTWPVTFSGPWGSGSQPATYNLGPNGRQHIAGGGGPAVTLTDSPQTRTWNISAEHYFGTTSDSLTITYPARFARTPTGLTVTRVSDSRHDLSWTRNSTYTSVVVQRRTDSGSWVEVGRPSGNASSFSDLTTSANHRYEYRVAGIGGSGQSPFSTVATVYTTPAPVATVTATRVGNDISVDVTGVAPYATAHDVYDNGVLAQSGVSFPWVDVAPNPAITHTYTVVSKRGALSSAHSDPSNTVQLQAPPNPPSNLSPNGLIREAGANNTLVWQHNPVDSSGQTAFELRFRVIGELSWRTRTGTTAESWTGILTDQFASWAVGDVEWQVRTKGAHANFSAWSDVAVVTLISRPTVAINEPDSTHDQPVLTAEWTYSQSESFPQSSWTAVLSDGVDVLETRSGTGATDEVTFNTRLEDGGTYDVTVTVAAGDVVSAPAFQQFTVAFVPPATPTVSGGWVEATGNVQLLVDAGVGGAPTVSILVERSVHGGAFEPVLTVDPGREVPDYESLSNGVTEYRVTAVAATGAAASVIYPVTADSGAFWLSGGPAFATALRLPFNPTLTFADSRDRSLHQYEGRTRPVSYAGEHETTGLTVTGMLIDREDHSAEVDELRSLIRDPAPVHMFRDPDGRRIYVTVGSVNIPRQQAVDRVDGWAGVWQYSFTATESERG